MAMNVTEVEALRKNFFSNYVAAFERSVDQQLSDPVWVKNSLTVHEGRQGYRFIQLGEMNEAEMQEVKRRYIEAGWSHVEIVNLGEDPRRVVRMDLSLPVPVPPFSTPLRELANETA